MTQLDQTPRTQSSQRPRLILVYNADSGIIQALMHAVHKLFRPATYPCSLCAITYGAVSMRGEWKRFLDSLPMDVVFHHRDDFTAVFPEFGTGGVNEAALPSILIADAGANPRVIVPDTELDAMADAGELMERVTEALALERVNAPRLTAVA